MATMRALVYRSPDGAEPPVLADVPRPSPAAGELLVAVKAVGLNRADLQRRPGFYGAAAGAAHVAGLELAGEVLAVGPQVTRFQAGDRVMAAAASACAEYAVVHECMACPAPHGYSWAEAAATYVCFATAHDALAGLARLKAGEDVLIQGVTSGIGIAAVQVARVLGAARIIGTSRSRERLDRLAPFGLDLGLTHGGDAPAGGAPPRGVDVVLDLIGSAVAGHTLASLAPGGRWVSVGRIATEPAQVDLGVLAHKQATLIGMASRMRSTEQHARAIDAFRTDLMPALEARRLHPVIDRVFPFTDAPAAFACIAAGTHFGKLVVTLESAPRPAEPAVPRGDSNSPARRPP